MAPTIDGTRGPMRAPTTAPAQPEAPAAKPEPAAPQQTPPDSGTGAGTGAIAGASAITEPETVAEASDAFAEAADAVEEATEDVAADVNLDLAAATVVSAAAEQLEDAAVIPSHAVQTVMRNEATAAIDEVVDNEHVSESLRESADLVRDGRSSGLWAEEIDRTWHVHLFRAMDNLRELVEEYNSEPDAIGPDNLDPASVLKEHSAQANRQALELSLERSQEVWVR